MDALSKSINVGNQRTTDEYIQMIENVCTYDNIEYLPKFGAPTTFKFLEKYQCK